MQNFQSPGDSFSDMSVLSEPIPGTQRTKGNQSPGINTQLAGGAQSSGMHHTAPTTQATQGTNQGTQSPEISTQPAGGAQSSEMHQNEQNEPNNDPTQETQGASQETLSPVIGTQLEGGAQGSVRETKGTLALHIAGSILEKGLNALKGFAGFVPVPGLGPALEVVCGCIDVYHVCDLLMSV